MSTLLMRMQALTAPKIPSLIAMNLHGDRTHCMQKKKDHTLMVRFLIALMVHFELVGGSNNLYEFYSSELGGSARCVEYPGVE